MKKTYTVGRGSAADIRIPKVHDAVGKLHLEIEDVGHGQARITDLNSTNGTFVRVGRKWEEVKGSRTVAFEGEIMLGDYTTTPHRLLSEAVTAPLGQGSGEKKYRSSKEEPDEDEKKPATPPPLPVAGKKRTGPRRNEFGEIVHE